MDTKALKWLEERGVEIFKQAVLSEFYGYDLFEKEGGNYYRFQPHAQGDAVCLRPIGGRHEEYEAFLIEEAVKYPDQGIFPALCDFSHCEPVQRHFLDDSLLQRIENQLKQGGQTFAQKVNQAFVNVLMMAAGPIETRVEVRDTGLDVLLAQVGDGLSE
ncbi:MAG: hypothetical protein J7M16_09725, partial [Anaerolineae bacterium]|nr:hypothetical protein [Anaerolineae bacterium]